MFKSGEPLNGDRADDESDPTSRGEEGDENAVDDNDPALTSE